VATARPTCLYCGAALGRALEAAATAAAPIAPQPALARTLLVLTLGGADGVPLRRALGLSAFDAQQWVRRGGYRLHCIVQDADAEREAERLAASGLRVLRLAEVEVRAALQPKVVVAGTWSEGALAARSTEGPERVAPEDVLLVVKGPIARERQALDDPKRVRTAAPEAGFRIHVHRRGEPRPLELDPEVIALGRAAQSGALLELTAWAQALAQGRAADDAFRYLTPELAPAEPVDVGPTVAAGALAPNAPLRRGAPLLLDNVRQFRFYSAWRGAVERHAPPPPPASSS
jgi:hypothetical protein